MRRLVISVVAAALAASITVIVVRTSRGHSAEPSSTLDDALLEWPLPPGEQAYGRIDGRHLHRYVDEQAAISRQYRDQGHPKFWGRIIGTSADAESAEWLAGRFKQARLSAVALPNIALMPQGMRRGWALAVTRGGKTIALDSAQPNYAAVATPAGGLDLEAVYAGLG